jgi:hypothetical protein
MPDLQKDDLFPREPIDPAAGQLAAAITLIRDRLPTPAERLKNPGKRALQDLAERIGGVSGRGALRRLAGDLTSQETSLLFPFLCQPETSVRLARRVTALIREKACPSLYLSGWSIWQHVYPHSASARALALLCRNLAPDAAPLLISSLLDPRRQRFAAQLAARIIRSGERLGPTAATYRLDLRSPLGQAAGRAFFLNLPAAAFATDLAALETWFSAADLDGRAAVASHYLAQAAAETPGHDAVCQLLFRLFGDPDADAAIRHPMWAAVGAKETELYRRWIIRATIGSHCLGQETRALFYLDFSDQISKLERWDKDTLLLRFPGFLLADDRRQPGLALYYDQPQSGGHPLGPAALRLGTNPASKAIPHRQVDDAVRNQNFAGIVGLPFDDDGIRLSRLFLTLRLQEKG